MKTRLLFVDDDQQLLAGLRRMLRPMRNEWNVDFAKGGQEALSLLAGNEYDVIVSDMRMPDMDGSELLNRVMQTYPNMLRIALSGQSDIGMIMKSVRPVHQYLTKPCSPEMLIDTINNALRTRKILENKSLKKLVSQIDSLPSIPDLYSKILEELKSDDASIQSIGRIIAQDVGMTAQILKLVNSAFFGFFRQITDPVQAVSILGLETIKSLVLSIEIFSLFSRDIVRWFPLDSIWNHSKQVSVFAKNIAGHCSENASVINESFSAGFLHDIGKLIMVSRMPDQYRLVIEQSRADQIPAHQLELEVFETTHAELGGYLLGLWGLPDSLVEAVAFHHHPARTEDTSFTTLTAVYLANLFSGKQGSVTELITEEERTYLDQLRLTARLDEIQSACAKPISEDK